MLTYRTFRNTDPPAVAALWRSRQGQPGFNQPVSVDLLEQLVFAKLYFDYAGLVLAFDDGRPVGFAHAGFGPSAEKNWVASDVGVTCVVVTRPDGNEEEAVSGLLDHCEQYLRSRGAKLLYGGGIAPLDPFWLGLYDGSQLPGVLDSDAVFRRVLAARGYQEIERRVTLHRDLGTFEAPVDRRQMLVRRQTSFRVTPDAPTQTWWEASTLGEFDLTRVELLPRGGGSVLAAATFRNIEATGTSCVTHGVGLIALSVDQTYRRRGVATFLLAEAFRHFLRQGVARVETQTSESDTLALATFHRLGFQDVGTSGVWRKD
ncbi:MAG: GNAT family N-acetyltransferase [Thermoguttaceae bacterium]